MSETAAPNDPQAAANEAAENKENVNPSNVNSEKAKSTGISNEAQYKLPDEKTMIQAGGMMIKDENGKEVPFKSLYENQPGRQLIVFIRHFYCGMCEQYIMHLSKNLPPSTLSSTTPPTTLTIIGCGPPAPIADYRTRTMSALPADQKYKIYCDPTRKIYEKLGMLINLGQSEKSPGYQTKGTMMTTLESMKNMILAGPKGFKGPFAQNGGEWLFEDGELKWCRRMQNTQDHAEVEELKKVLGME